MAVELNDTTIPATYQLAERTGTLPLDADLTDCCCEHGPAARVATAV
jgi:hypothetical protein